MPSISMAPCPCPTRAISRTPLLSRCPAGPVADTPSLAPSSLVASSLALFKSLHCLSLGLSRPLVLGVLDVARPLTLLLCSGCYNSSRFSPAFLTLPCFSNPPTVYPQPSRFMLATTVPDSRHEPSSSLVIPRWLLAIDLRIAIFFNLFWLLFCASLSGLRRFIPPSPTFQTSSWIPPPPFSIFVRLPRHFSGRWESRRLQQAIKSCQPALPLLCCTAIWRRLSLLLDTL
jgi:hypothetical protein